MSPRLLSGAVSAFAPHPARHNTSSTQMIPRIFMVISSLCFAFYLYTRKIKELVTKKPAAIATGCEIIFH
jgi:hypothetical protein